MSQYYLTNEELEAFVSKLMERLEVWAPVAKGSRFIFDKLTDVDELRLDYDTTILPPKKMFFPPKQVLLEFDGGKAEAPPPPTEKVLLGIHPYDLRAISMTDKLFEMNYPDRNYLANRAAATIIGMNVQNPYEHSFFGSIAQNMELSGYDAMLTKITGGYVFNTTSEKGVELTEGLELANASAEQIEKASAEFEKSEKSSPFELSHDADAVQKKVRGSFDSDIWKELAEDCLSCGSCNIVCPTCYCFDIQDEWGLGAANGKRYRRWDACQTAEFSQVSVQGGSENFREDKQERYRHRVMRKTAYLNETLGAPACVGCGRCAGACTAGIADPVKTIKRIMES
ncbi:MAG: 4Fe-4S dicluster domain-containing protein [Victivallales bacterium]|nr:4Fe-4S dicluster domain-containing protein [Victivallales bacterium]